jgi:hypothetical protein
MRRSSYSLRCAIVGDAALLVFAAMRDRIRYDARLSLMCLPVAFELVARGMQCRHPLPAMPPPKSRDDERRARRNTTTPEEKSQGHEERGRDIAGRLVRRHQPPGTMFRRGRLSRSRVRAPHGAEPGFVLLMRRGIFQTPRQHLARGPDRGTQGANLPRCALRCRAPCHAASTKRKGSPSVCVVPGGLGRVAWSDFGRKHEREQRSRSAFQTDARSLLE